MKSITATVLTIGDEILIGQIVNTNAAWIGEQLTTLGVRPLRMETVGDEAAKIKDSLLRAMEESRVVIVTGGLGPTHDDITRDVVADVFGVALCSDEEILAIVRERFTRRGKEMPASNISQSMVPEGFEAIVNPAGTAPALLRGFDHEDGEALLAVLPGVPYEMQHFMSEHVLGRIAKLEGAPIVLQKTLLTVGAGESHLHEALEGVEALLTGGRSLAYLPNLSTLRLRLTSVDDSPTIAEERLAELESFIRSRANEWIYGEGLDTLEAVIGRLLRDRKMTVATAESCTGGRLADRLTNVPGSSDYLLGGIISYDNAVKIESLGVQPDTLDSYGAVSRQTACEMAEGVRHRLNASIGISTTGVLGPGGGSGEKPVGTLWIGVSTEKRTSAVKMTLGKERLRNKERAVVSALAILKNVVLAFEPE